MSVEMTRKDADEKADSTNTTVTRSGQSVLCAFSLSVLSSQSVWGLPLHWFSAWGVKPMSPKTGPGMTRFQLRSKSGDSNW